MEVQVPKKQIEDIARFYDFLQSPSGIIEAFYIAPTGQKDTRYYDDRDRFIHDVVAFNHHGFTCYVGIQPRARKLLGSNRSGNGEDVVALRLLVLDLDPVTPGKTNASDEETACCLEVTRQIATRISNGIGYRRPL